MLISPTFCKKAWKVLRLSIFILSTITSASAGNNLSLSTGEVHSFEVHPSDWRENYGDDYTFSWSASDGAPLSGTGRVFQWKAPVVEDIRDVKLSVTVIDQRCGCTADDETTLTVLPGPTAPNLTIEARSSRDLVTPGSAFNYTFLFKNSGVTAASNVTVTCDLDDKLDIEASTHLPDITRDGIYQWRCGTLHSGESGSISMELRAEGSIGHPHPRTFINRYRINSDEFEGAFVESEILCVNSLWVNKYADQKVCDPGDVLTYNISFGNSEEIPAEDVVVIDRLPDVEFIESHPPPDRFEGGMLQWLIGPLAAQANASITVTVKVKERPEVYFGESSYIEGDGFVSTRRRMGSESPEVDLVNCANITGRYWNQDRTQWTYSRDFDQVSVSLSNALESSLDMEGHGSGTSSIEGRYGLDAKNGSISVSKSAHMDQRSISLSLPRGREVEIDSLWREQTASESFGGGEKISEDLMYAKSASTNISWQADANQSVYRSEIEFSEGRDRMRYVTSGKGGMDIGVDIDQEFDGSFEVERFMDSYKGDIRYRGFSTGMGYVASARETGDKIRAREVGSGSYNSSDALDGRSIYARSMMYYHPYNKSLGSLEINRSLKWEDVALTEDVDDGLIIGEMISRGGFIENEVVIDESSLSSYGRFDGEFELTASKRSNSGSPVIDIAQRFSGKYDMSLAVSVRDAPKYLGPHVNITKKAVVRDGDKVTFDIYVTNDGNTTLGPIYVVDIFPEGMIFINSSIRPSISDHRVNWTISYMPPNARQSITVAMRIDGSEQYLLNTAFVEAHFPGGNITAQTSCLIPSTSLPCCVVRAAALENQSSSEEREDPFSCFETIDEFDDGEMCEICL